MRGALCGSAQIAKKCGNKQKNIERLFDAASKVAETAHNICREVGSYAQFAVVDANFAVNSLACAVTIRLFVLRSV